MAGSPSKDTGTSQGHTVVTLVTGLCDTAVRKTSTQSNLPTTVSGVDACPAQAAPEWSPGKVTGAEGWVSQGAEGDPEPSEGRPDLCSGGRIRKPFNTG